MKLLTEQDIGPRPPDWPTGCRITCNHCGNHFLIEPNDELKIIGEWSNSTSFALKSCPTCQENGYTEIPHTLRPQPLKKTLANVTESD